MAFRDLALGERVPRSDFVQFYSAVPNIGNYLPVAAIHGMMGRPLDCWNIHDPDIDFGFVNARYRAAIVGGAGLLHPVFLPFWKRFAEECTLPFVLWGVGGCFPDGVDVSGVRAFVGKAMRRCVACNVRDEITARTYGLGDATVTACPTILYVADNFTRDASARRSVLYARHVELTGEGLHAEIERALRDAVGRSLLQTDNTQRPRWGAGDIVRGSYSRSRLVVTTRLHGAIIAYALRIPYIALAVDGKLGAFASRFGNGVVLDTVEQLRGALPVADRIRLEEPEYEPVRSFGRKARAILESS
jgi:hypothetical protein